jgi:hypothetical protein
LQAYALIRDDKESQRKFGEIRLRACVRIGEISKELDKSKGGSNPQSTLPIDGKSKEQQLKEAGISTSSANRYEELAGPTVETEILSRGVYGGNAPRRFCSKPRRVARSTSNRRLPDHASGHRRSAELLNFGRAGKLGTQDQTA